MIDNFELITSLLKFENQYDFYDLQIIRRGKDHPNLPSANKTIKSYYIEDVGHLHHLKDEIIKLCELFGARAYIYPSVKNFKDVVSSAIMEFARRNKEGDFKKPQKIFSSCVGKEKSREPIWIVDYDFDYNKSPKKSSSEVEEIIHFIENECKPNKKVICIIPTKNGCHLLTHPFDKKTFKDKYPDIEIKTNNPTILYVPNG